MDEPLEGSSQFDKGPLGPQWEAEQSGPEPRSGTPQNPSVTEPHSKAQFIGGDPELKAQNSPPPGWQQEEVARNNFMGAHGLTMRPGSSGTKPTVRKPPLRPGQVGHSNIGGSSITGSAPPSMQRPVNQNVPHPENELTGEPQLNNAQAQQDHHQGMLKRTVSRLTNPGPNGEPPLVEQAFQLHYRGRLLARPGGWKEAIRGSYGKEPIAWENPMKAASVGEGGASMQDAVASQVFRNRQQRQQ